MPLAVPKSYCPPVLLTVVPIANLINNRGYEVAFLYFGIAQGVVVILCALVLRAPRPGELPETPTVRQQSRRDFTPFETLGTPAFWLMYLMMTMLAMGGLMATAQLGPIATDYQVAKIPVSLFGLSMAALPFALSLERLLNGLALDLLPAQGALGVGRSDGQIRRRYLLGAEDGHALHHVFQFAHVARPGAGEQGVDGGGGKPRLGLAQVAGSAAQEKGRQEESGHEENHFSAKNEASGTAISDEVSRP